VVRLLQCTRATFVFLASKSACRPHVPSSSGFGSQPGSKFNGSSVLGNLTSMPMKMEYRAKYPSKFRPPVKILPRISVTRIDLSVCCPSVVIVANGSLDLAAREIVLQVFHISLGDTRRCYGVSLCRADASGQRRARCRLPFFRKAGRNPSCHER